MTILRKDIEIIGTANSFQKCPLLLSEIDNKTTQEAYICYICESELKDERYIDHNWHSGAFIGRCMLWELCQKKS